MSPKVAKGKDASTMMAESFDCVTIFYGEIVGFDKIIAECKADEVGGKKIDTLQFSSFNHPGARLHKPFPRAPWLPHEEISGDTDLNQKGLWWFDTIGVQPAKKLKTLKMIGMVQCARCTTHKKNKKRKNNAKKEEKERKDCDGLVHQVYNPQTMEDEILMVSGMPLRIGKNHINH